MTQVFASFAEYWYYARHLTNKQRQAILRSLTKETREALEASYVNDGWHDLFVRNQLDSLLDEVHKEFGMDLLQIRCLVVGGRNVYVQRRFWEYVNKKFNGFSPRSLYYIFGGYRTADSYTGRDEYKLIRLEGK